MKFSTSQALVGALAPLAAAFPAVLQDLAADPQMAARAAEILGERQALVAADGATKIFEPVPIFDAKAQYINIGPGSGHEYVAPGPNDLRGPCPGLNAFANHGFLPHNGYATISQFVDATTKVVGMGPVLALFLAAFGAAIDGDGLAWSIGGTPSIAQAGLLGSRANGISGSHNKYEGDSSPTRPDLYQEGNDYMTKADQFKQMIDESGDRTINLNSLTSFRSKRFDTQIRNNPNFFNGPFTGVLVQPAAYTFIYRFMANHSAENPYGLLNEDVAKSWFGITGNYGSYVANQGQEKIPNNWYRRAQAYPYETTYFLADVVNAAANYPKFLNVGGNTGTTNSFAGVNIEDLTGGVMNSAALLDPAKLGCFAFQAAAQAKPDVVLAVLNPLTSAVNGLLGPLACPKLQAIDQAQLRQFPGYRQ